jgi:hypothetical protein
MLARSHSFPVGERGFKERDEFCPDARLFALVSLREERVKILDGLRAEVDSRLRGNDSVKAKD